MLDEDRRYVRRDKRFATPSAPGDERTRDRARRLQNDSTVLLDAELAVVAAQAVVDACRKRGWRISRGALMANHVHVVITGCPADGSSVKRILKGVSQARLSDYAGRNRRWWTRGGSNRAEHGSRAVGAAELYVEDQPGILVRIADSVIVSDWPPRLSR